MYEEIESLRGYMTTSSEIGNVLSSKPENDLWSTSSLPPSILRPPDVSDILLNIWNEDEHTKISDTSSYNNSITGLSEYPNVYKSDKSLPNNGVSRCIIPRPKVGWPSRRVTFGKIFFIYFSA